MISTLALALVCFLIFTGCAGEPEPEPTPTFSAEIQLGADTFTQNCAICHAITPDTVIRGPSMHGIATRAESRVSGQDARAYIYSSILQPGDYIVDGFENVMLNNFGKSLTGEELDALVAYLLTFE